MRINHNISALNTYRSLSSNINRTSKSLEKLSSGLRINRAGDDAAGLAISEKMRGQIRGLNQAERNAQDGISMIQTAEGALHEVHAILQRMKELATQAANGTNTDADRAEIQKEINQLTAEINRIANNTEFNTKKVLNGGAQISLVGVDTTTPPATEEPTGETSDLETTTPYAKSSDLTVTTETEPNSGAIGSITPGTTTPGQAGSGDGTAAVWNTGAVTAVDDDDSGTFIFNGVTVTVSTGGAAAVSIDATGEVSIGIDNGGGAAATAQAILDALNHYKDNGTEEQNELDRFTFGGDENGITITGLADDGDDNNDLTITGTIAIANAPEDQLTTEGVDPTSAEVFGKTSFTIATALGAGDTFTVAGQTITVYETDEAMGEDAFGISLESAATAEGQAEAIRNMTFEGLTASGEGAEVILTQDVAGTGDVTGASSVTGASATKGVYSIDVENAVEAGGGYEIDGVLIKVVSDAEAYADEIAAGTAILVGEDAAAQGTNLAAAINANATLSAKYTATVSETKITLTQNTVSEGSAPAASSSPALQGGNLTVNTITPPIEAPATGSLSDVSSEAGDEATPSSTTFTIATPLAAGESFTVAGKTITVYESDADAADDAFGISLESAATAEAQAEAIRNMDFGDDLDVTGADAQVILTQKVSGTGDVSEASSVVGAGTTKGVYSFSMATALAVGEKYTIDGVEIEVVNDAEAYADEIAAGTAILVGEDAAAQRTNLAAAINANATLSAKYTAAVSETNMTLTQKIASESAEAPVVSVPEKLASERAAVFSFDITTNFAAGDTITIGTEPFIFGDGEDGTVAVGEDIAATAANLRAAITAAGTYVASGEGANIILTQVTPAAGEAPAMSLAGAGSTPGVYNFSMNTAVEVGGSYIIDNIEIEVVDDAEAFADQIAAGTAILAGEDVEEQMENLVEAINANTTLSAKYTAEVSGTDVTLTQVVASETAPAPVVLTSKEANAPGIFSTSLQIGANQGQSFSISIGDMRAQRLGISGISEATVATGFEATVVGASFSSGESNRLSDTTTAGIAEYALDVSDTGKASAAIAVLDQAITQVSAERSKLGAYQNRLEHTINNLGTSAENLTAAESRIRDVDMAKEMMEFTKNTILQQAAQAMLAQANQQPQQVLQLLQ